VGVRVVENGIVRLFLSGNKTEKLQQLRVDLSAYEGRRLWLEIIDAATGPWGHVLVDEIELRSW
jgi:levanase